MTQLILEMRGVSRHYGVGAARVEALTGIDSMSLPGV